MLNLLIAIGTGTLFGAYLVYTLTDPKEFREFLYNLEKAASVRKVLLLSTAYFIIFQLSVLSYWARSDLFSRPTMYFGALSLLPAIVLIEIFVFPKERLSVRALIMFQTILIPLSYILTLRYMYPTLLGRDPWVHSYLVEIMVDLGRIPESLSHPIHTGKNIAYTKLPGFHLLVYLIIFLGNLEYKVAETIIGTILLFGYSLAIILFSRRVSKLQVIGLGAILFVGIADGVLELTGKVIIPNALGILLNLLIIYFVMMSQLNARMLISLLILSVYLATTHSISSATLIIFLIANIFSHHLSVLKNNRNIRQSRTQLLFLAAVAIIVFSWWSYVATLYLAGVTRISTQLYMFIHSLFELDIKSPRNRNLLLNISPADIVLGRIPLLLYVVFSMLGAVITIKLIRNGIYGNRIFTRNIQKYFFGLFIPLLALLGVSLFVPQLAAVSHRLWGFFDVIASVFIFVFFTWLAEKSNLVTRLAPWTLLIILMVGISTINFTSPLVSEDKSFIQYGNPLTALSPSEVQLIKFIVLKIFDDEKVAMIDFDYYRTARVIAYRLHPPVADKIDNFKSLDQYIDLSDETLGALRKRLKGRYFQLGKGYGSKIEIVLDDKEFRELIKKLVIKNNVVYNSDGAIVWTPANL